MLLNPLRFAGRDSVLERTRTGGLTRPHPLDAGLGLALSSRFMQAYWRSHNVATAYDYEYEYEGMGSGRAVFSKVARDIHLSIHLAALDASPCEGVAIAFAPHGALLDCASEEQLARALAEFSPGSARPEARFPFSELDGAQLAVLASVALHIRVEDVLRGKC